jgi:Ca-activated chloride channel homolog
MITVAAMTPAELAEQTTTTDDGGLGALRTEKGNLPLDELDVRASITGLVARTEIAQGFRNAYDQPLEATYIFPLPDRAAVTAMRMEADGRVVEAELNERGAARESYDKAIAAGQRASIAEQERPDVFTMRVGNILPGERVVIRLALVAPLPYADGEAEYRLPLVVAPRYIPGDPLPGVPVGDGTVPDTDAVPDASRIRPPVLLPGFPNPVALSIAVDIDPAGLPLSGARSSLHTVQTGTEGASTSVVIEPGERVDRDFLLRLGYGTAAASTALALSEDESGGTFQLTVLPPVSAAAPRPRDVVLVLDRSGSMHGWKMVAARRAAARIVDTLTGADRFAVLTFDHSIDRPDGLSQGLVDGSDRNRYRAVEHLARVDARGGTEMLAPLREAAALLTDPERDRVLVLVTDGQVGNEDQILADLAAPLGSVRVHTVGIDRAVNAGFLGRLAALGGGRCELVESEDRLDEATDRIHQRIGAPLLTSVRLAPEGFTFADGTVSPARIPAVFPGVPLVVRGRWDGTAGTGAIQVTGVAPDGTPWSERVAATTVADSALTPVWARSHLRDLEDEYAIGDGDAAALEKRIVATSLRFGVLCRFTAFVAVDTRVVTDGTGPHKVTQPVEVPSGWETPVPAALPMAAAAPMAAPMAMRMGPVASAGMASDTSAAEVHAVSSAPAMPAGFAPRAAMRLAKYGRSPGAGTSALDAVRALAVVEARRLRDNASDDEPSRRIALADLASRLDALLQHLTDDPATADLRALTTDLAACEGPNPPRGADLTALYTRAITTLGAFAGPTTPTPKAPTTSRATFWKRT